MLKQNSIGQVYLALDPTDLRKSIDGLSLIVQESFQLDPFSKNLFVFCNRKRDKIKILEWDKNGFWLHYKRLEKNIFRWPDGNKDISMMISEQQFRWLLDGLSIHQKGAHPDVQERIII